MGNTIKEKAPLLLMICLLVLLIGLMSGCAGAPGLTEKDIDRRHYHSVYTDWLMFQDDMDKILMIDRPSRMTPLYNR